MLSLKCFSRVKFTKTFLFCGLSAVSALPGMASTISDVSWNDSTQTRIAGVSPTTATGANMGPMLVTVNFVNGDTDFCFWSTSLMGCNGTNSMFTIRVSAGDTRNATWTVDNNHANVFGSGENLVSFTINALAGYVGFDQCLNGLTGNKPGVPGPTSNPNQFCLGTGTTNSGTGLAAQDGTGGNNTMSVVYSNRLYTPTQNLGDLYGTATFTVDGSSFTPSEVFTWEMDTDLMVTPEPATFGMMGFALIVLGGIRRKYSRR
jgi:hypothetical protein